jgi:pimeloyl-ACP methyl ester carboxylesterase
MSVIELETGLTLSGIDQGDRSDTAILFLPGPTDSCHSYRPTLDRMPESIRCVAVSQRGHGDSDKPESGYRVEDFAGDVPLLLDALQIRRAILVGHSGSCLTARRVALDHPDRVAGLVLEASPTTLRDNPDLTEFVESIVASLTDPIDAGFARSVVIGTSALDLDPNTVDRLAGELMKVPARVWREMFGALLQYDDLASVGRIAAPTLMIWGDADRIVGRSMQDELLRSLPHALLLVYPGTGHTPRWEQPVRFASDVSEFASRLRSGRATPLLNG